MISDKSKSHFVYIKDFNRFMFNKTRIFLCLQKFQLSNIYWICDGLFDIADEKIRDHCHVTGRYRGATHWSCNANCNMTKKVSVIFDNLKDYDSRLIIKEVSKFDMKVGVIPNELEKYMAFTINGSLVFIDSLQYMKSSLDSLVKNLMDKDFRY